MSRDKTQVGRTRRAIVYLGLVAAALWLVADTFLDIRAFVYEHHGIEFYRQKPYLIALCPLLAVAASFCIKVIADHKR